MVRQFALSLSISDKSANALNEFGLSPIHNSGVECNVPSCECPNRRFFGQVDGISKHWPTYEDQPELVSPSVILYENWTMQRHRGIRGTRYLFPPLRELLCMPGTLHSRLRVFSMTLLARINLDSTQLL